MENLSNAFQADDIIMHTGMSQSHVKDEVMIISQNIAIFKNTYDTIYRYHDYSLTSIRLIQTMSKPSVLVCVLR